MAYPKVAIAGLILSAALPLVCYGPVESRTPLHFAVPARQIEAPDLERQNIDAATQTPSQNQPFEPDEPDVPFEEIDFGLAHIGELANSGQTTLEISGLAPITLTMERVRTHAGMTSMTLSHDGLTSTLTRRGERFYLALATPRGTYRVTGDPHATRVVDNQVLNQRMIATDMDFKHAH